MSAKVPSGYRDFSHQPKTCTLGDYPPEDDPDHESVEMGLRAVAPYGPSDIEENELSGIMKQECTSI